MSNKLGFRVSSALKNIVGKDLIVNDYIAIFELVKNSFDAQATHVTITFDNNSITIADNGKGMTLDDIKNKWLFLAYSAKKEGSEDQQKGDNYRDKIHERRYYAGAKGIGRFSSDRLGQELTLTTKTKNSDSCEQILVEWAKFEKDQTKEFVEIDVDHTSFPYSDHLFPNNSSQGTVLKINNLNDEWPSLKLRTLRRSLEKLINPFSNQNSFSIEIICEKEIEEDKSRAEGDKINGVLRNSILDALNQKTTQIDVIISSTDVVTEIKDRGINIYKIREPNYDSLLAGTSISLLFLNRSARHTFTSRMGIQSVEYGSIFLYKNGFRIYPYGEPGDDSWGIDARKQQGYNRYLGSRDLIGKVEIYTNHNDEFKETSSRDGGLVKTHGATILHETFEKAHRRLERYVVGVLWGEGFKKRDFFVSDEIADEYRKRLAQDKDLDKMSNVIKSNLGSKLDFTQIIKGLAKEKDVEILEYNEELTKFIADELDTATVKIDILKDIEEIAEKTGNDSLKDEIEKIARALHEETLKREQAELEAKEAERRLLEEIARREKAQRDAEEAEKARIIAEEKRRKEELAKQEEVIKRRAAEQDAREKELRLKEEKLKREEEERKRKYAEAQNAETKTKLEKETKQGIFQRSIIGKEKEQILGLQHQINHSSSRIKNNINRLLKHIAKTDIDGQILKYISIISLEASKIESISNYVTSANFDLKASEIKQDLIQFVDEYIKEMYSIEDPILKSSLNISVNYSSDLNCILEFRPLEITTFIDNFIQNSEKAGAKQIGFKFFKQNGNIFLDISDNGKGIPNENILQIFDFGFTTTDGAGIGLYNIKSVVDRMKWKIEVIPNNKGANFKITIQ
ncbi:MAG: ATP-binding protein [Dysgonomonas sp.]|nr:ATP-binding protein [Dysgonomonas sp.]